MGKESESTKVYYDFYLDFYVLQTVTTSPDSAIHVFFYTASIRTPSIITASYHKGSRQFYTMLVEAGIL